MGFGLELKIEPGSLQNRGKLLLVLSCLVCSCCWLAVCIVVVVLCVLLSSYMYLLYYVCIAVCLL